MQKNVTNKNFCKYNLCNDHIITKIMKVFYYKYLEPYGIQLITFSIYYVVCYPELSLTAV